MPAPNYEPENTALPVGHLEDLRMGTVNNQFNAEFAAFQKNWQEQFRAWLDAHDKRVLAEHGVTDGE